MPASACKRLVFFLTAVTIVSYQSAHAFLVIGSVVDGVHTDGVDAELLELRDVALATSYVGDGILCIGGATCSRSVLGAKQRVLHHTWLVVDTADVETLVACEESCALLAKLMRCTWWQKPTISLNSNGCDRTLLDCGGTGSSSGREDGGNSKSLHYGGYVS